MSKRIIILGAVVILVVLVWIGGWLFFAGQIRQEVEALALADGETQPQLTCDDLGVGGFPFRFDLHCTDVSLVAGDILAQAPQMRASAMVYRPNHVRLWLEGPVELSDAFTGQRSTLDWTGMEASIRIENWRIARVSLIADAVTWTDRLFESQIAKADHVEFHLLDMPEQHDAERHLAALAAFARLDTVDAPGFALTGANAELEAELTALPDDIRQIGAEPLLPAWQRNGGTLRLTRLHATDPTATLEASGNISLDDQGLANGSIDITSTGVAERIGPMIEEPWRTLVLGVPGEDGSHTNQINLRGGTVSSGLVPIAAIPPAF